MRPYILNESVAAATKDTFTLTFNENVVLKLLCFYFPKNQQMLVHITPRKRTARGSYEPLFKAVGTNAYISGSGDSFHTFYISELMEPGDALVVEVDNTDPADAQNVFMSVQGVAVNG